MSDLGPEAGALIRAAREEGGLSPGERMRLRAGVLSAAHAGMLSAAGTAAATTAAAKTLGLSTMGWIAFSGLLSAAGAGAYYVSSRAPAKAPAVAATITSAPAVAPSADPAGVRPVPAPVDSSSHEDATGPGVAPRMADTSATKPRALEASRPAPAASADTHFAEDARLLRDVRAALASGQSEHALALLDARGADESAGVLAEEREAARIVTLCKLGRQAEARTAAGRFLAAHSGSPLAERVRRACPAEPDEAPR